ncbi:MAG: DUF4349 domain-containing protein [Clostridia bacterium]|nr:DUF4349 domain-containing protein [Clostridia bacterium]
MKKSFYKIMLVTVIVLMILSSCSSKNNSLTGGRVDGSEENLKADIAPEMTPETGTPGSNSSGSSLDFSTNLDNEQINTGRKIIENIRLNAQTKEFDKLLDDLNAQISALGGYTESSNITGREFESTRNRSAEFIIRIPCQNTASFTEFVSTSCVVINKSVSTQDVTLNYVDMESRVTALESEKIALEKLLNSAETITEIVNIQDKLTDVIYEIESYKSKLRTYDNLVDYSTITIHIYEVEQTAIIEELTVFEKIGNNLKSNFEHVWDGLISIFIFIISAIPYMIPLAIVAVVAFIIIRSRIKKSKSKEVKTEE